MKTLFIYVLAVIVVSKSLPIRDLDDDKIKVATIEFPSDNTESNDTVISRKALRNSIRPGLIVSKYEITLEPDVNSGSFSGTAEIDVNILDLATREEDIHFHVENLNVESVSYRVSGGSLVFDVEPEVDDDGLLIISTEDRPASQYTFIIEYTGSLELAGVGLFTGTYPGNNYVGMNLNPTNARRVFPCLDEPTEASTISFAFNNLNYNHVVSNAMPEENTQSEFRALTAPPHLMGMVAHNFESMLLPTQGVQVYGRTWLSTSNDAQATAISFVFTNLNTWTNKNFFEIDMNQDGRLVILALPDVDTEWNSLSTLGIWEPYVVMDVEFSAKQRSIALVKVAEAIARQWFGYVVYPENWRYQWVTSGLGSYAAWEMLRQLEVPTGGPADMSILDINTLFTTEVIQESLLRDAAIRSTILEPDEDLFDVADIRDHISSVKYKAPAIMRMLRLILGDEDTDIVQVACQSLLNARSLLTVNSFNFYDAVHSEFEGNAFVEDIEEYMQQWLKNTGYPIVFITARTGSLVVTQERFAFTNPQQTSFEVPLTFTSSVNPNFDDVYPDRIMEQSSDIIDMFLDEDDWVLFNIQGQGYYRVNYAEDLWERIIGALNEPERRAVIHPLNRGTLVDDVLNLARANRQSYETAFEVVLTMEHETEYAPWRAFVRNMDFLRKRLEALVTEDEDLDPDIYLRMVRRTIRSVEDELGFYPSLQLSESRMESLTRGLVMDHACRAGYQPCIAAAVDLFYEAGASEPTVNPDINKDIRPAVYCTMVREGDDAVIEALERRLEIEPTQYERVVILESLGCSRDMDFINVLLESTIAGNTPYLTEERFRILSSVIQSSYSSVFVALNFMRRRTDEIRNMYGGPQKLDELIYLLADNIANDVLATEFNNWRSDRNNLLGDSEDAADRAWDIIQENLNWDAANRDFVYEWIDENDAPTLAISLVLLCITAFVTLFNH